MPQLTLIQRTKVVEFWPQAKSTIQVQYKFWQFFNKADAPTARTIRTTAAKFSTFGTVCNVNQGHSGRKRSAQSIENVDYVRKFVGRSQGSRLVVSLHDIHRASVQRILRNDLNLFPYNIQSQSELTPEQKIPRLEFAQWFSGKLETNEHFIEKKFTWQTNVKFIFQG